MSENGRARENIETGNLFHRKPLKKNKMTDRGKPTDGFNEMMTNVANSNPFGKNINTLPKNTERAMTRPDIDLYKTSPDPINALLRRITLLENELDEYKNYAETTFAKIKNMEKEMEELETRIMRSID